MALPFLGFGREKAVHLRNETIRTLKPSATEKATEPDKAGLWIVQFEDGFRPEWLEPLRSMGAEVVKSIPEDAFLVHLSTPGVSALRKVPFVQWVGRYKPEYKLQKGTSHGEGEREVQVLFKRNLKPEDKVKALGKSPKMKQRSRGIYGTIFEGRLTPKEIITLSQSDAVLWIEPAGKPKLYDAISSQIVAGDPGNTRSTWIHDLGFTGNGVTVAVADSGLMGGEGVPMHPDLDGRVTAFFHYGELEDAADEHSHGTHVAGIIAGNGATGEADEEGYLYGLGIAPEANIVAQRLFDGVGGYHPPPSFGVMVQDAMEAGAEIGSNSWGEDTQGRYDLFAMEFDALVRDGNLAVPGDQPYILEFSAGNAGPGSRTIGTPALAKNVIATGASQNNRPEFLFYAEGQDAMADFSSRGPCDDGRIKPDVVAPGTWIASLQSSYASDENAWMPISPNYLFQGGTSQAGPQVSGAAAVFVQYYREVNDGATPSPALVKAALINSAVDMDDFSGTRPVPNNDEGWGRVDLVELIDSDKTYEFVEQGTPLQNGQTFAKSIVILDSSLSLKVTMAYTDVPGFPGAIPALVNDLDLELVSPSGIIYRGNQFLAGESVGNAPATDKVNNVEAIHISEPEQGEYIVRVIGRSILEDARQDTGLLDQDFAIAISGTIPEPNVAVLFPEKRFYSLPSTVQIRLIDFDQSSPSVPVIVRSTRETAPFSIDLNRAGSGIYTGAVDLISGTPQQDNILQVQHGDSIHFEYFDISSGITISGSAVVDTVAPVISEVSVTNRFGAANFTWNTDEPARGVVEYGLTTGLGASVTNVGLNSSQLIPLSGLIPGQTYYFRVIAYDAAGNRVTNDNNGALYSFVAEGVPPVLIVNAYFHSDEYESEFIPVSDYTSALDALGVGYEIWDVDQNDSPPIEVLRPYKVVIWRINDSMWDSTSISGEEQTLITEYIEGGGSFFLASMEIISRMGAVPFRSDVLQVKDFRPNEDPFSDCPECDEDHGVPSIHGDSRDSLMQGISASLDYSNYPEFDVVFFVIGPDLSDTFGPGTNAVSILTEDAGRTVGIRSPRFSTTGRGRVIFLSFPLDSVPFNQRVALLEKSFNFLAPGLSGAADLTLDNTVYTLPSLVNIELGDSDLAGTGQATVRVKTDSSPNGIIVNLQESVRPGIFHGFFALVATNTSQLAEIIAGPDDRIVVEYSDASANSTSSAEARVDVVVPTISSVDYEESYEDAYVYWSTDKMCDALVQYGESPLLGKTAYRGSLEFDHELLVTGLLPGKTYYFRVVSRDQAGNVVVDDNNGDFYTLTTLTPEPAPYFEDFEGLLTGVWDVYSDSDFGAREWQLGTPANSLSDSGNSGTLAWGTNLRDESFDEAHAFLISPAIYLEPGKAATLSFYHNYDFTGPATLESGQLLLFTNSQTQPLVLATYGDFTFGWEEEVYDLSPYSGRVIQVVWEYLLLDLEATFEPKSGWLVDDVSVSIEDISTGVITVTNNLSQGRFQMSGASTHTGAGNLVVISNAAVGNYSVVFQSVPFYTTPPPQSFNVSAGQVHTVTANYTMTDGNQNGISDSWEQTYPGAATGDVDGDGATGYSEFMAGTDPKNGASVFKLLTPMPTGTNRVLLRWSSSPGHSYKILRSSDAQIWTEETAWLRSTNAENNYTVFGLTNRSTLFRVQVRP